VRPWVSSQPLPLGDRLICLRPIQRCRPVHPTTHPHRDRGFSPRRFQNNAPLARWIASQPQRSSQKSIQSFFPSTSDGRRTELPRPYIPPRDIQPDPLMVLKDSNSEPMQPLSPPSPSVIIYTFTSMARFFRVSDISLSMSFELSNPYHGNSHFVSVHL
jgi:hypothetical protein